MYNDLGRWHANISVLFGFYIRKVGLFYTLPLTLRQPIIRLLLLSLAAGAFTAAPAQADVQHVYVYDEAGRLVQAIAPDGASAHYRYDEADNLLAVSHFAAGDLALVEFTPNSGSIGTAVTLWGSGFSPLLEDNSVEFNGITATDIVSVTTNKLVVNVPPGAATGPISVTTSAGTAVSADVFTLEENQGGLAITGFTPNIGAVGTPVTVSGNQFDVFPANNIAKFNNTPAMVSAATTTTLQTKVPQGATSGYIAVATLNGTALSADDFFVPPDGSNASDFSLTGRIAVNGASSTLSLAAAGKGALIIFDGSASQRLGLGISALTLTPSAYTSLTISVLKPDGTPLTTCNSYSAPGGRCVLAALPADDTYTIRAMPNSSGVTANLTLTLSSDVSGTLVTGEPALTFATARVGQNARYTFTGTVGQNLALLFSGNTFTGSTSVYVDKPDGVLWTSTSVGTAGKTLNLMNLPVAGDYTVRLVPSGTVTGQINVTLQ